MRNSWIGIEMKIEDKEAPEAPWETPSRGDSVKGRSGRNSRDAELPIADSKASQPVAYSIHAQIACAGDLTRPNPRSISGGPPALEGTWLAPTSFPDLSSDHSKIRKCSIAGSLSSWPPLHMEREMQTWLGRGAVADGIAMYCVHDVQRACRWENNAC